MTTKKKYPAPISKKQTGHATPRKKPAQTTKSKAPEKTLAKKGQLQSLFFEATTAVAYNRVGALAYARNNWNKVATDLFIASSNHNPPFVSAPANTVFVHRPPDGSIPVHHDDAMSGSQLVLDWNGTDDCTHFLSCCIGKPPNGTAGGLSVPQDFPTGPYGVIACQRLFDWLKSQPNAKLVVEKKSDPTLISQISAGDLIFYWNASLGRYHHAGMFLGSPSYAIACHTYSRSDAHDKWPMHWFDSAPDRTFSFFKLS